MGIRYFVMKKDTVDWTASVTINHMSIDVVCAECNDLLKTGDKVLITDGYDTFEMTHIHHFEKEEI